jgi:hypothetical protein
MCQRLRGGHHCGQWREEPDNDALPGGQGWNTNALSTDGTISIVALTAPTTASIQVAGGKSLDQRIGRPHQLELLHSDFDQSGGGRVDADWHQSL